MCLSIEWELYTCRDSNPEQLRKIHQRIGTPAGIEPTPHRVKCHKILMVTINIFHQVHSM